MYFNMSFRNGLVLLFSGLSILLHAQTFSRYEIPVKHDGEFLAQPWVGGLNTPQFLAADLNRDQVQDLVVFDRVGDKVLTFLNLGTPGESSYIYAPEYAGNFPPITDYMVLRDYNKDGAADIFCASIPQGSQEMQVFTGYYEGNVLKFRPYIFHYPNCFACVPEQIWLPSESQPGLWENLNISKADYPDVDDIDGDGDLDIITFAATIGGHVWWIKNTSKELGLPLDSLRFRLADDCWGRFYESGVLPCINDLSPSPTGCVNGLTNGGIGGVRHPGSTVMVYDQEGDGDKEIVLGDISFACLNMMTNGGTPSNAWMNAQDTGFPSYNAPVDISIFPAAFYLDLDNDGKKDMIAAPNNETIGEDQKNAWFYKNTASSGHNFQLQTRSFLVQDMIDHGTGTHPTFADVNADGLMDLVVGTYGYFLAANASSTNARLYLYLNTGTATQPQFELSNSDWLQMSQFAPDNFEFSPTFGDLDGDGDLDLLIGNDIGSFFYQRNIAGPGQPMQFQLDTDAMWITMDVNGQVSTPTIFDLDGDGLKDIIAGERLGFINFFKNIGLPGAPKFNLVPTVENVGSIDTRQPNQFLGFSAPTVWQTPDGPMLVAGTQGGHYEAYVGIQPNSTAAQLLTETLGNLDDGLRSHPAFADLDADGQLEMLTGNARGGLSLYKTNLQDYTVATNNPAAEKIVLRATPNPANNWTRIEGLPEQPAQWQLFDTFGRLIAEGQTNGENALTLRLEKQVGGLYFFNVRYANGSAALRLMLDF
jgi:hypothetical protein